MKILNEKSLGWLPDEPNHDKDDYELFMGIADFNGVHVPYTREQTITDKDEDGNLYFTDFVFVDKEYEDYWETLDNWFNS